VDAAQVDVSLPLCKRGERLSDPSTPSRNPEKEMTVPTKTPTVVRCRYTGKYLGCGEPAVDILGELLLCTTHLDLARQLIRRVDRKKAKP